MRLIFTPLIGNVLTGYYFVKKDIREGPGKTSVEIDFIVYSNWGKDRLNQRKHEGKTFWMSKAEQNVFVALQWCVVEILQQVFGKMFGLFWPTSPRNSEVTLAVEVTDTTNQHGLDTIEFTWNAAGLWAITLVAEARVLDDLCLPIPAMYLIESG